MGEVVDHLAELTGFRDRDLLDVSLAAALRDLVRPEGIAVFRCVGDAGARRWLTRARLGANDAVAGADSLWSDLDSLPALDAFPERAEAVRTQQVVLAPGVPHRAVFPLVTDRDVVGVVEIETVRPLSAKSRKLVASILRIYRNFQSLLDYSERDTLTGLLNRKTFDESFMKASSAARSDLHPEADDERRHPDAAHEDTWLGVIDIDHFKNVNDNYGHLIGDEVLLLLSRLMRGSFRFHDHLYRFGGEEFVVLMRCCGGGAAANAFERLRRLTEHYAFPQVGRITVSIGFTQVKAGDTPSGAFERADRAVYYAKSHGRNMVCSHAELVAQGELQDESKTGDVELF